jgi:hypothetical protein
MTSTTLKESLLRIADRIDPSTSIEDVFKELSLIADIDESERQEESENTISHDDVKVQAKQWLK